jgi:hypothetical protein
MSDKPAFRRLTPNLLESRVFGKLAVAIPGGGIEVAPDTVLRAVAGRGLAEVRSIFARMSTANK